MLSPKLERYFREYDQYHLHPTNRLTHKVAIPLIVFHIVAMLGWLRLPFAVVGLELTVAHLAYLAAIAWYASLNLKLALIMALLYGACLALAPLVPWPVVVGIAVVGWAVQLAGHAVWEKRSPAFLTNILQALIGPLYFCALLTGDWQAPVASTRAPAPASGSSRGDAPL